MNKQKLERKPNIVFIFADQHRHDAMGCAGNAFVSRGTRFTNAWCQSPICQPSRAALITSRYPSELGVLRNFGPDMDPEWPTFMKQLQSSGYATANIGKTHYYAKGLVEPGTDVDMRDMSAQVASFGFDHVVEEFDRYVHAMEGVTTPYTEYLKQEGVFETYRDQIKSIWRLTEQHWDGVTSPLSKEQDLTSFLTREAQSWIEKQTPEQPFFLQLSYVQPHVPLMGDPDWAQYYSELAIPRGPGIAEFENEPVWDGYLSWCGHHAQSHRLSDDYVLQGARQYYAMISLIDECVGSIVDQLEARGMLDNTLFVYSSDHGEMLGDHGLMAKFNFYRSSVQVPLIVVPPQNSWGDNWSGRTSEALVEVIDIGPTLLDAAGAPPLADVQGRSVLSPATDPVGRDFIFSEIQQQSRKEVAPTFRAVRDQRYRCTVETTTNTVCELFDLERDPGELHNLVRDPAYRAQIDQFRELVDAKVA